MCYSQKQPSRIRFCPIRGVQSLYTQTGEPMRSILQTCLYFYQIFRIFQHHVNRKTNIPPVVAKDRLYIRSFPYYFYSFSQSNKKKR